jgi:hypothetical protein
VTIHLSRDNVHIPTGAGGIAPKSLNVNLPSPVSLTQIMLKRLRGGPQRGSQEIQFAVFPQAGGAGGSGGVFIRLQSGMGTKRFVKDPRDQKCYCLNFDATVVGEVKLQDSIRPTAKVLFTGTGLNSSPVGPGNWYRMLMQLVRQSDNGFLLRVRQSNTTMSSPPVWTRVTNMPDVLFEPDEVLDPGWMGMFAYGTTGDLVKFNSFQLSNTLTEL